jgi:hypothetical protein
MKNDHALRCQPTNLHVQLYTVMQSSSRYSHTYDIVSVGAFAAHAYKFKKGGGCALRDTVQKLQADGHKLIKGAGDKSHDQQLKHKEEDKLESDAAKGRVKLMKALQMAVGLQIRMDAVCCQALGALVTSFTTKVEVSLLQSRLHVLRNMQKVGAMFQFESLLSAQGKELHMVEDHYEGIRWLRRVSFQLVKALPGNYTTMKQPPAYVPAANGGAHMTDKKNGTEDAGGSVVIVGGKAEEETGANEKVQREFESYLPSRQLKRGQVQLIVLEPSRFINSNNSGSPTDNAFLKAGDGMRKTGLNNDTSRWNLFYVLRATPNSVLCNC